MPFVSEPLEPAATPVGLVAEPAATAAGTVVGSSAAEAAAALPSPAPSGKQAPGSLGIRHHALALTLALIGGPLGVVGAVAQELQAGLFGFLAAGVIEEALKPAGIYILLVLWPYVLRNRLYTATLTAVSGLAFALIEAAVYIWVYFPEGGSDFVAYRLTVPLALHTGCSFLFGLGIKRTIVDWANGAAAFPKDSRNYMVAAMVIHAGFNLVAVILELSGVIEFDEPT